MLSKIKTPAVKRHIAKTITWRIVGTIDTMILGWLISGNPMTGVKIGGLEVITKMGLYFAHERIWYKSRFGLPVNKSDQQASNESEKNKQNKE